MNKLELRRVIEYRVDQTWRGVDDPEWIKCDAFGIKRRHDKKWAVVFLDTQRQSLFIECDLRFDEDAFSIEEEYFYELYHAVKSLLHPNRDDLDNDCAQYLLNEIDGRRLLKET